MDFTGDSVLVTGGSRGIGRACALGFAQRGARVAINYLENTTAAEKTLADLVGDGHAVIQADITDPEAVKGLAVAHLQIRRKPSGLTGNCCDDSENWCQGALWRRLP